MAWTELEYSMLSETVARYLGDRTDLDAWKAADRGDNGWKGALWTGLADDLQLLGVGFGEEQGGLGGGVEAHAIVMTEFGRWLVSEPYLATAVIAGRFLEASSSPFASGWITGVIDGHIRVGFAHAESQSRFDPAHVATRADRDGAAFRISGQKLPVFGGGAATHFLIIARSSGADRDAAGLSAFLIPRDAPGMQVRPFRTHAGEHVCSLELDNVQVSREALLLPEGGAFPVLEQSLDVARTLICAEAVGIMDALIDQTAAYLQQRVQFSRPLSQNQALQHRLADMHIRRTHSAALVNSAITAQGGGREEARMMASAAKAYVGKAARFCAQNAVQLHGGIGMTDELRIGGYFKRIMEIELQFGSIDYHIGRFSAEAYASPPSVS